MPRLRVMARAIEEVGRNLGAPICRTGSALFNKLRGGKLSVEGDKFPGSLSLRDQKNAWRGAVNINRKESRQRKSKNARQPASSTDWRR